MFNKIRRDYHLRAYNRITERYMYTRNTAYRQNPIFKWHKRQLIKLMPELKRGCKEIKHS